MPSRGRDGTLEALRVVNSQDQYQLLDELRLATAWRPLSASRKLSIKSSSTPSGPLT